jgi:hypothetical protein
MEHYLKQQQQLQNMSDAGSENGSSVYGGKQSNTISTVETPDNIALEEFKHQVKMWMDIDNQIKKLNQAVKEKKTVQKVLSDKILTFMSRYNIEDLNTKDGKLRAKVSYTKPAVKKTSIKEKLLNYFEHDKETGKKVTDAVFDEDQVQKVEKVSLKRLKGVRIMNV